MSKKIVVFFLIVIVILGNLSTIYAASAASGPNSDIWGLAKRWLRLGEENHDDIGIGSTDNWNYFSELTGILWGIGVFIILIWGTTLGIRYMFASVEAKADIKKGLIPLGIGAVIIFGALGIWQIIVNTFEGISY